MRRAATWALAIAAAAPAAAHAANPMVTDDARLTDAKACQVESWVRGNVDSTELWLAPACNPEGHVEIAFAAARARADGASRLAEESLQVKTVLRTLDDHHVGVGLAVGATRRRAPAGAPDPGAEPYLNVPVSAVVIGDDRWVAHLNLGAVRRRDENRTLATWGFGHEIRVTPELFVMPEVFRNDFGRAFYQVAARREIVRDRLYLNLAAGDRVHGKGERWWSIGIKLQLAPFIP